MKVYEIINANAESVATEIHKGLDDTMPSIFSLVKWTEENFGLKIKINYTDSDKFERSGLVYFDKISETHKIWINSREPEYRQRFTLCHEIAHVIRNSGLKYGFSTGNIYSALGEERFCDRFAAAFLMPANLFTYQWNAIREPEFLKKARLAGHFKVSGEAVYHRAKELRLLKMSLNH